MSHARARSFSAIGIALLFALVMSLSARGQEDTPRPEPRFKGKPAGHWIKRLESKEAADRLRAVEALGTLSPDALAAVSALVKTLRDENDKVRLAALKALKQAGPNGREAIPALAAALADNSPVYRESAAKALASIGPDRRAVPALVALLRPPEQRVVGAHLLPTWDAAIKALGQAGPDAVPPLAEALKDPDAGFRENVARALTAMGPDAKAAVPALQEALKVSSERSRLAPELKGREREQQVTRMHIEQRFRNSAIHALKAIADASGGVPPR